MSGPNKQEEKKLPVNTAEDNANLQGNDKAPGEERGKKEQVTLKDLKGKKVDADPNKESDKPVDG